MLEIARILKLEQQVFAVFQVSVALLDQPLNVFLFDHR